MNVTDLPHLSLYVVGIALAGVFLHLLFDGAQWRGADRLPLDDDLEVSNRE